MGISYGKGKNTVYITVKQGAVVALFDKKYYSGCIESIGSDGKPLAFEALSFKHHYELQNPVAPLQYARVKKKDSSRISRKELVKLYSQPEKPAPLIPAAPPGKAALRTSEEEAFPEGAALRASAAIKRVRVKGKVKVKVKATNRQILTLVEAFLSKVSVAGSGPGALCMVELEIHGRKVAYSGTSLRAAMRSAIESEMELSGFDYEGYSG